MSPDKKEHPPDFSSGDAEGWQEYGNLKKQVRFAPKIQFDFNLNEFPTIKGMQYSLK